LTEIIIPVSLRPETAGFCCMYDVEVTILRRRKMMYKFANEGPSGCFSEFSRLLVKTTVLKGAKSSVMYTGNRGSCVHMDQAQAHHMGNIMVSTV
jgi:hypothetical protein